MHRSRIWIAAAATLSVAIALGYLATRNSASPPAAPRERLSIAMPLSPHTALLRIAAAQGYFTEEGLDVTIIAAAHGGIAVDHVVRGEANLATGSEVVFVLAALRGEPLAIAANMLSSTGDLAVIARRDRGIDRELDLAGKTIGVTLGTSSEYFLWVFLIRNKLPLDAARIVNVLPLEIPRQLANATLDAAVAWQPNVTPAAAALGANAVTFKTAAYVETFNLIGRAEYLKSHSAAIAKLVRALLKAEQHTREHPEESLAIVAAQLGLGADDLRPAWNEFTFGLELTQSQLVTLEDVAAWAMARGYIEKGAVPNFLPALYLDALLAVDPARVTVAR